MLWIMVLKLLDLFEGLLDYFVQVQAQFNKMADGQWNLVTIDSAVTPKGKAVLDSVVTIIHYGLDFVAQFTTLLPALENVNYNNIP